jgi:hypothetical protein
VPAAVIPSPKSDTRKASGDGMPDLEIRIESDLALDSGITGAPTQLAEGIEVSQVLSLSKSAPHVFFISIAENVVLPVAADVASSWVYKLLARAQGTALTINWHPIDTITRDEIQRVIERELDCRH